MTLPGTYWIYGYVTDSHGAVSGATVSISGDSCETDASGYYQLNAIGENDNSTVTVEATNGSSTVTSYIYLDTSNLTTQLDFMLPTSVQVSNISGCVQSGARSAVLSAKVTNGTGYVTFYYESGSSGGGTTISNWDYSSQYASLLTSGNYIEKTIQGLEPEWTYSFRGYISSNGQGAGEDWFNSTDTFTTTEADSELGVAGKSMRIYISCNNYPNNYIDCWCTRWDEDNWGVTFETFMDSSNRNLLFRNVVPGAVRELYNILGTPKFIDTTYDSGNSIIIEPSSNTGLANIRDKRTLAVKSISDTFISNKYFAIKIEGKRLDTGD